MEFSTGTICLCIQLFAQGDIEAGSHDEGNDIRNRLGTDQTELADDGIEDDEQGDEEQCLSDDGEHEGVVS